MGKVFTPCANEDQTVLDMADQIIRRYYPEFIDAGLTIFYVFVETDGIGAALSHGGYPAAGACKINSLKDRVEGKADCTITIDKAWWAGHDTRQNLAMLDHELHHILIAKDDDNKFILDDCGRPKVKLRKHDWQHGGFLEIAKRHRMASVDMHSIMEVQGVFVQANLFAGDDMHPNEAA
jgi:hypothetical protein